MGRDEELEELEGEKGISREKKKEGEAEEEVS